MKINQTTAAVALGGLLALAWAGTAGAVNPGETDIDTDTGDECTYSFTNDLDVTLVVSANGDTRKLTPGESTEVGPFETDTIVAYRWFGGPERDHDLPLWANHPDASDGTNADFIAEVNAYEAEHGDGSWSWATAGPEGTAPFVTWEYVEVTGCPSSDDDEDEGTNDGDVDGNDDVGDTDGVTNETSDDASSDETADTDTAAKLPQTGSATAVVVVAALALLAAGAALTVSGRGRG